VGAREIARAAEIEKGDTAENHRISSHGYLGISEVKGEGEGNKRRGKKKKFRWKESDVQQKPDSSRREVQLRAEVSGAPENSPT